MKKYKQMKTHVEKRWGERKRKCFTCAQISVDINLPSEREYENARVAIAKGACRKTRNKIFLRNAISIIRPSESCSFDIT